MMQSRRNLVIATSTLLAAGISTRAFADDAEAVDYLLVQTSKGLAFDKATSTLSLIDVSPVTLFFSDRPERIAGNMKTSAFIPFWSHGKDSFAKNPPNADVSIMGQTQHSCHHTQGSSRVRVMLKTGGTVPTGL